MLDNQKFGKRLVQAGIITQAQLDEALRQQQVQEGRLGEILVRLGYVSESTVLQYLAAEFRTRYVSTERLAKARIPQQVLDLLPVHIAERYNLIPVLFDSENSTLSIVTSDPQNEASLREVHMITRVRELRVYVALQSAVQAAIRKHYRGEINAFTEVQQRSGSHLGGNYETGESAAVSGYYPDQYGNESESTMYVPPSAVGTGYGGNAYAPAAAPSYGGQDMYGMNSSSFGYGDGSLSPSYQTPAPQSFDTNNSNYNYDPHGHYEHSRNSYQQQGYGHDDLSEDYDNDVTRLHVNLPLPQNGLPIQNYNEAHAPNYANNEIADPQDYAGTRRATDPRFQAIQVNAGIRIVPLLRMLSETLEQKEPRYHRHLSSQEVLLQAIVRRLELRPDDADNLWMAFYLHHIDLPIPHPCLFSLHENNELLQKTKQHHESFTEKLARFQLPPETLKILEHLYERYDGQGFPEQLKGADIPQGARLLAVLDSYAELKNKNATLGENEIFQQLKKQEGNLFDPELLALVSKEAMRFDKHAKGLIPSVLVFDSNRESAAQIEQNLLQKDLWTQIVYELDSAERACINENVDLMVIDFDNASESGVTIDFVEKLREKIPSLEFLLVGDNESLAQGIELGRDYIDYLTKPFNIKMLLSRIEKQINKIQKDKSRKEDTPRSRGGIAGSLEQFALPDLLQPLSQSRRSGVLELVHSEKEKGFIYLDLGHVINATCGNLKGEQAFYKLISWEKGSFSHDPNGKTDERLINAPLDSLILEGLRLLDEARRSGADPVGEELDFEMGFEEDHAEEEEEPSKPPEKPVEPAAAAPKTPAPKTKAPLDTLFDGLDDAEFSEGIFASDFADAAKKKSTS